MATNSPIPNRLDLSFPPDVLQACLAALQTLLEVLPQYLVDIGPDERRRLAKAGPSNTDFTQRAMVLMRAMPQYKPGYADIDAFQRDLDAMVLLVTMRDQLRKCLDLVDDSLMLAGTDGFAVARAFYKALQAAAALGSLDAQVAADDLAQRLPSRHPAKPASTPGATPPTASDPSSGS